MATKVSVQYTPSLNVSITKRDGLVTRVTTWTTGVPGSTERVHDVPRPKRFPRKR